MKPIGVIVLVAVVALPLVAKDDLDPARYQQTGHVISAEFIHTTAPSNRRVTEIRIGALIYVADSICKGANVGSDYPAQVDQKYIRLLVGKKVCKYRVTGTREAPK